MIELNTGKSPFILASSVIETELASLVTIMITLLGITIPLLPAATKLGQGNVFTGVCDSVHGGGGLPQCMLGYHLPPGPDPPGSRHPTPPGTRPSWEQTHPPGADTPHTPRSRHPGADTPPPPEQTPSSNQSSPNCMFRILLFL